jgi:hypothetical protein
LLAHPFAALWATPTKASFILEKGCAFGNMGRVEKSAVDILQKIQQGLSNRLRQYQELRRFVPPITLLMDFSMKSTLTRLRDCPMTFRDVVAQFADLQRVCLDLKAVLDFISTYEPCLQTNEPPPLAADMTLMGSFTSNLEIANKMYKCGIPVWLVRTREQLPPSFKIRRIISYTDPPHDIVTNDWHDEQTNVDKPFPCLHYGFGGADRHDKCRLMGSSMFDVAVLERPELSDMNYRAVATPPSLVEASHKPSRKYVRSFFSCCR